MLRRAGRKREKQQMKPEQLKALAGPSRSLREIVLDKELAALGDALVNFAYSLARSLSEGRPRGGRLDNRLLSEAFRAAGLREEAPRRMSRHELADAAEALLAYGWLMGMVNLQDLVDAMRKPDIIAGLSALLASLAEELRCSPRS